MAHATRAGVLKATNYNKVEWAIGHKRDFKHSTMTGYWVKSVDTYYIASYGRVIGFYDASADRWYALDMGFSVTTTRHQNLMRKVIKEGSEECLSY